MLSFFFYRIGIYVRISGTIRKLIIGVFFWLKFKIFRVCYTYFRLIFYKDGGVAGFLTLFAFFSEILRFRGEYKGMFIECIIFGIRV